MDLQKEVFSGKKISDLVEEIYNRQKDQEASLKDKIELLSNYIEGPGDAIAIIPLIKDLLDTGVKNNEMLLKIVQLFKQNSDAKSGEGSSDLLSEKDIQQLFDEVSAFNNTSADKKNYLINGK